MKKRLLTLITIFALLSTCLGLSTMAVADSDWRDGYVFSKMAYNADTNVWVNTYGGQYPSNISHNAQYNVPFLFAENGTKVAMVLTSPIDGTMTFGECWSWMERAEASMGVAVYYNDTVIAERTVVVNADGLRAFALPASINVSQGDKVYIVYDPDGSHDYDVVKVCFNATITPAEGEAVTITTIGSLPNATESYGWEYFTLNAPTTVATKDVSYKYEVIDMAWSAADGIWVGQEPFSRVHSANSGFYGILPGSNENIALVYEVPASGLLTFNHTGHVLWNCGTGGPVGITVLHNGKVLVERQLVAAGSAIDPTSGTKIKVKAGDEIIFMVDGNGNNAHTNSVLLLDMSIAPEDGSAAINANFQSSFSSNQGQGGWYYRSYVPKAYARP